MDVGFKDKALDALLRAELAAGNLVAEVTSWPPKCERLIILTYRFLFVAAFLLAFGVKAASAQINFSEETPRLAAIEASVNDCAMKQEMTVCLNALAHARMLRRGIVAEPMSADRVMMETVELVPLYVLSRRAQMDGDKKAACDYAGEGEARLLEIALMTELLAVEDPTAFKRVERTFAGLGALRERYDEVLAGCVTLE